MAKRMARSKCGNFIGILYGVAVVLVGITLWRYVYGSIPSLPAKHSYFEDEKSHGAMPTLSENPKKRDSLQSQTLGSSSPLDLNSTDFQLRKASVEHSIVQNIPTNLMNTPSNQFKGT